MKSLQLAIEILSAFFVINLAVGTSIEKWPTYKHPHSGNGKTYLCYMCPPGYYKSRDCVLPRDNKPGYPECLPCPESQYSQRWNRDGRCWDHDKCEKNHATIYYGGNTGPTKCACTGSNLEDSSGFCVSGISMADHQKEIKSVRKEYEEKLNDAMKTTPCTCPTCPTCPTEKAQMDSTVSSPTSESLKSSVNLWFIFGILMFVIGILIGIICIVYTIFLKRKLQRCKSGSAKDVEKGKKSKEDGSQRQHQSSPTHPTPSSEETNSDEPEERRPLMTDEHPSQRGSPNQPSTRHQPNENGTQRNSREDANMQRTPSVSAPVEPTPPVDQQNQNHQQNGNPPQSPSTNVARHNRRDEEVRKPLEPLQVDIPFRKGNLKDSENAPEDEHSSQRILPASPTSTKHQPNKDDSQKNSSEYVKKKNEVPATYVEIPPEPQKAMLDGNPVEPTTRVDEQNLQYDGAMRNSHRDKNVRVRDDDPLRNGNPEDSEKQLDDGLRILENSVINEAEADYILRNGLRLTASECQKIANRKNTPAEVIREGYNLWRQQQGSRADIHALIAALRRCEKRYTADKIVQECGIKERKGNQTVKEYPLELAIRSCEKIVVDGKIIEFFRSNLRLGDREMEELMRDRKTFARKGLLKWVEKNTKENATAEKLIGHFLSADMKNLADNIIDDIRKEYPHYVYKMDSGNVSLQEEPRGTDLKAGPIASSATGTEAECSLPELAAGSTSRGHGSPNSERSSRQLFSDSQSEGSVSRRQPSSSTSASNTRTGTTREEPESSSLTLPKATQITAVEKILRAKEDPSNSETWEEWDLTKSHDSEDGKSANRVLSTTPSSNGSLNMNNSETRHKEPIAVSTSKTSQQMSLDSSSSCHKEQKK